VIDSLSTVGFETWFAATYCVALVGLAYVIDRLARRAGAAAEGGATFGFSYHEDHDAWKCPEDQWLWPQSFDPDHRVMRYRATPSICNACPVKETCTPTSSGREVQRAIDVWPASEAARFHRGIACAVVLMGLVWPIGALATRPGAVGSIVLVTAVVGSLLLSLPLWSHLRRSTVVLPEGMVHRSLDETMAERALTATAVQQRRSRFASTRRDEGSDATW
jgi:hypothetical protein